MSVRSSIIAFDTYWARAVGTIPAWHRGWLHILGICTLPMVWCGVLGMMLVLQVMLKNLFTETLIVIALIPLGSVVKAIVRRKRPPTIYANHMKIKTLSFPSGHAYASMTAAGYLVYMCLSHNAWGVALVLISLIALIGISRVHLGAHYPSDVIGGWLIGGVVIAMVILI